MVSMSIESILMLSNLIISLMVILGSAYSWLTGGVVRRVARALVMIENMSHSVNELDQWREDVNLTLVGLARVHDRVDEREVMRKLDTGLDTSVLKTKDELDTELD